jgi:hypothetical protein
MRLAPVAGGGAFARSRRGAEKSAVPNRFGAIAYHRTTWSRGLSYDKARERDASSRR